MLYDSNYVYSAHECIICDCNKTYKILIMAISANKKFWTEFIDIYHSLPSLWNTKDENYNNREIRSFAWNKLVEKLQEAEPEADQDSVKRKINTFRSNFNREVRKIRLTQKELSKEIYSPTLWYFDQLSFLLNQEKRNNVSCIDGQYDEEMTIMGLINAKKEINESESISQEDVMEIGTNSHYEKSIQNKSMSRVKTKNFDIDIEPEQNPLEQNTIIEAPLKELTPKPLTTPRNLPLLENHKRSENVGELLEPQYMPTSRPLRIKKSKLRLKTQEPYSSHKFQSNFPSSLFTDEAAIYGQAWACGFRKLSPQQKIFAKKAIEEILILGQLKGLKLNTVQINSNLLEEHSDEN